MAEKAGTINSLGENLWNFECLGKLHVRDITNEQSQWECLKIIRENIVNEEEKKPESKLDKKKRKEKLLPKIKLRIQSRFSILLQRWKFSRCASKGQKK